MRPVRTSELVQVDSKKNQPRDTFVIAFDKELRWIENPGQQLVQDLANNLRYSAPSMGSSIFVWDTRNTHGKHDDVGKSIEVSLCWEQHLKWFGKRYIIPKPSGGFRIFKV